MSSVAKCPQREGNSVQYFIVAAGHDHICKAPLKAQSADCGNKSPERDKNHYRHTNEGKNQGNKLPVIAGFTEGFPIGPPYCRHFGVNKADSDWNSVSSIGPEFRNYRCSPLH